MTFSLTSSYPEPCPPPPSPSPTGLMPRFSQFINEIKRTIGDIVLWRHEVMPLILPLGTSSRPPSGGLPRCTRASSPASCPPRRAHAGRWPTAWRPSRPRPEPRPPGIPPGPVLMTVFRVGFDEQLQALLDDPEMRALLAASPQAGRSCGRCGASSRPGRCPTVLRLPPRPRRPKPRRREAAGRARRRAGEGCADRAGQRPAPPLVTAGLWEPTPCLPPFPD